MISKGKKQKKFRVDELAVRQGVASDATVAMRLILAGEIRTGDHIWRSVGEMIPEDTLLERKGRRCGHVSRGGLKLELGLANFPISVEGKICLDIGSSTGGFTEVLLRRGAESVTAVDVGYGLLEASLRSDPRVFVLERTNFRTAPDELLLNSRNNNSVEPRFFDLVVTDVSFISLRLILPRAVRLMKDDGDIIALVKPQFEAPVGDIPEGGVVSDPEVRERVVASLCSYLDECGLKLSGKVAYDIGKPRKNIELLCWFRKNLIQQTGS